VKLEELKDAVQAVEPAAVLVSHRLLARVIREVHHLSTQFLQVPHHRSFVIDRQALFRHVEQDELDLDPDRRLPATVVLLVRPSAADGDLPDRSSMLLKYWQRLFHATVDRALDERVKAGKLLGSDLKERIAAIGEMEFAEIRGVLARDHWLLPPVDDLVVYSEFVAVYLELRYFFPTLRSIYFPATRDFAKIDAIIAQDVDGEALWKATRLPGAPDPTVRNDSRSDDSHEYYWRLVRSAEAAAKANNHVRAAILRTKAARVAPGALTLETRTEAAFELHRLAQRLQIALQLTEADTVEWQSALVSLLEKADQGPWTVEARLLYDLQQVCVDTERDVFKLDLVEWILSAAKRPIKRPLPSQRLVQVTRHLRAASGRIPLARLSDADRQHLSRLLQATLHQSEQHLRTQLRPIFSDAFHDVGLVAANPPEETAFRKMIEELLDRIIALGFFTFGDLRDVISRNNLKLRDLADPQEFVRGDALLQLDRRLASLLDGVYRCAEVYFRVLARSTSLLFGTDTGRNVTRNFLLPFGGAFAIMFALEHLIAPIVYELGVQFTLAPLWTFSPVGLFILCLMRLPDFRRKCLVACQGVGEGLRLVVHGPFWLVRQPALQRVLRSWLFQLLWWYVLKPLVFSFIVWLALPNYGHPVVLFGIVFAVAAYMLNSRLGHAASEILAVGLVDLYEKLRSGLIAGLVRFTTQLLKRIMDALEQVLYAIDEWLRFRTGDTYASMVVRIILGTLWYPISFLIRLYVVVLIEPMFNPLKLPIAILAAKLMIPIYPWLGQVLRDLLTPLVGSETALFLAAVHVWLSGDLFGFLFWELTENWKLYRANRSPVLKPVMVGRHGETVLRLLRPGFHSGTVPRLYEHLRRAEQVAMTTGQWRTARAYRYQLQEVEESLRLFVQRELLVMLHLSRAWHDQPLKVGKVTLATQLIRIELEHPAHPDEPVCFAFAETAGWLSAHLENAGWLQNLPPTQREVLVTALAGWYKLAGVDLIGEQVQAALRGRNIGYDIEREGLALRSSHSAAGELVYPIHDTVRLNLLASANVAAALGPIPPVQTLIFARVPIFWRAWVDAWLREKQGQAPQLLPPDLDAALGGAPAEAAAISAEGNGELEKSNHQAVMSTGQPIALPVVGNHIKDLS
jgi:hypothetical protein